MTVYCPAIVTEYKNSIQGIIMPHANTQFDSSLSLAMVNEALLNPMVKTVLAEIASRLKTQILSELKNREAAGATPNLKSLAMQHSKGDEFVGALLPVYSDEILEKTPEGRALLLSVIEKCLEQAGNIETCHEFLALMKVIDGMAFVYDEFERERGNLFHARCKDYIAPTADEVAIRSRRPGNLLATTYGIDTEIGTDLIPENTSVTSCLSGKARFFILPPEYRMITWFEKLANQQHIGKPSLPLIASPSNAAAKVFMMSQGMGLFLRNGQFDLEKAQIFANCVMAYLVYSGHHSFIEVAEIWNRQLDFLAIEHPEQLPADIILSQSIDMPYMENTDIPERKLPYALVGDYSRFLHPDYRNAVIEQMNTQLAEGFDLSFRHR